VPFKTVPALSELLQGKARIGQLQEVRPEDLLGRDSVRLDLDRLREQLQGRRILVTGAGGSIGSELCRQLAALEPELLVLFERAENSLYFVHMELQSRHRKLHVVPVVGDILDRRKVEEVITAYAPEVIYHAAAYKHVPLTEAHPLEAIQNNVFGTETVALAARRGKVKKFVLISTDKAVRPVGVMGMTKRVAECLLLSLNGGPATFVAVRFGNVLGSDGSVLPIFRWQIAQGGPLTVTDPEATRYFMLMSEAAQLVLQAGAMGKGGEIFFLDTGEPVRIMDLAESLIRLYGLEPGRDIEIQIVGLRPGERLREELVQKQEELLPTEHEKVFKVQNSRFEFEGLRAHFEQDLERLRSLVEARDREGAVAMLKEMAIRY
jgi:FlaA1/EpsC-like NDP-sugar epimerase